jgi:hypothetical protein
MGEKLWKSNVFEWYERFKEGPENVEELKEVVVQDVTEPMKVLKVRNLVHSDRRLGIRAMAVQLNSDKETVTCVEKDLNFSPILFSTITMLQLTRRFLLSSFWPIYRLLKQNTHPFPLIWLRMTSCCFLK